MPVFKTGAINRSATSPATTVLLHLIRNRLIQLGLQPVFKTGAINRSANSPRQR
jgi:hypothetical protein